MAQPPPDTVLLNPPWDQPQSEENWFRKVFRFNRANVLEWMEKVVSRNDPNCPPGDLRTDDHFKLLSDIYDQIKSLAATKGDNYVAPKGPSHIYRKLNPRFGGKKQGKDPNVSNFLLETWTNKYNGGPDGREIQLDYWCIYDLIGLFFSLLGSAPVAANRNNFFLPLTAVYARWCTRLAGRLLNTASRQGDEPGVGEVPTMFQCTWRDRDDGTGKYFFLGASMAGDSFPKTPSGNDWKDTVQRWRFGMLLAHQQTPMVLSIEFLRTEPDREASATGNIWGNCAETFPFIHCMTSEINSNRNVQGLALSKTFVEQRELLLDYTGYSDGKIWQSVRGPCKNCEEIVRRVSGNLPRFADDFEMDMAPVRGNAPAPPQEPEIEAAEAFVIRHMEEPSVQEMVEVTSN
ncbi:hypothetical protein GGI35DRAFT_460747 [Trichoderma velutinum]